MFMFRLENLARIEDKVRGLDIPIAPNLGMIFGCI